MSSFLQRWILFGNWWGLYNFAEVSITSPIIVSSSQLNIIDKCWNKDLQLRPQSPIISSQSTQSPSNLTETTRPNSSSTSKKVHSQSCRSTDHLQTRIAIAWGQKGLGSSVPSSIITASFPHPVLKKFRLPVESVYLPRGYGGRQWVVYWKSKDFTQGCLECLQIKKSESVLASYQIQYYSLQT